MKKPSKPRKDSKFIKNPILDFFETLNIYECERYPAYWTQSMIEKEIMASKWADLGTDMAIQTIGQFRSLLVPLI
jgi:hypothetical protein